MDDIALAVLGGALKKDCAVSERALTTAAIRLEDATPAGLEGCAHHLARLFNVVEQMSLRVTKTFENIDDEQGWHAELIRRMTIAIPGVRPAFLADELAQPLH